MKTVVKLAIAASLLSIMPFKTNAASFETGATKIHLALTVQEDFATIGGITYFTPDVSLTSPCQSLFIGSSDKFMQAMVIKAINSQQTINISYDAQRGAPGDLTACFVNWIQTYKP